MDGPTIFAIIISGLALILVILALVRYCCKQASKKQTHISRNEIRAPNSHVYEVRYNEEQQAERPRYVEYSSVQAGEYPGVAVIMPILGPGEEHPSVVRIVPAQVEERLRNVEEPTQDVEQPSEVEEPTVEEPTQIEDHPPEYTNAPPPEYD